MWPHSHALYQNKSAISDKLKSTMIAGLLIRVGHWLARAFFVQIALLYVYVPILIAWGIPLSVLGIFGAVFFVPFLTTYLVVSSLLFITHICCIPNNWCAALLDFLARIWCWMLQFGQHVPCIGFVHPGFFVLILLPIIGAGIVRMTRKYAYFWRLCVLSVGITAVLGLLKIFTPRAQQTHIFYRTSYVNIVRDNEHVTVHLPRIKARLNSFARWWTCELTSCLYKNFGSCQIDEIVLEKPTKKFTQMVRTCAAHVHVRVM